MLNTAKKSLDFYRTLIPLKKYNAIKSIDFKICVMFSTVKHESIFRFESCQFYFEFKLYLPSLDFLASSFKRLSLNYNKKIDIIPELCGRRNPLRMDEGI